MSNDLTVYIHQRGKDNIEVVLTGRTAVRKTSRGKEATLHEITPKDQDLNFTDWVQLEKLFIIKD